jgi:hypothetical protein
MKGNQGEGGLQDASKSFSKNLKEGLKKALRGKKTSMADSAATVDTVESSAPSVDSVASDLPTPTFHRVSTQVAGLMSYSTTPSFLFANESSVAWVSCTEDI